MGDQEKHLIIREFGVTISAESHNPSILSPAFLEMYNIVDKTGELSKTDKPLNMYPYARVVYENGIQITSDQNKITFFDPLVNRLVKETPVIGMAKKYLEVVPLVKYVAVGINPSGDISVGPAEDDARCYLIDLIRTNTVWSEVAKGPVRATVNLIIPVSGAICSLSIEDGRLAQSGEPAKPVVIFRSNFHHEIEVSGAGGLWSQAVAIIEGWQADIDTFLGIVDRYFLENN
jgi:hypothetical protein